MDDRNKELVYQKHPNPLNVHSVFCVTVKLDTTKSLIMLFRLEMNLAI